MAGLLKYAALAIALAPLAGCGSKLASDLMGEGSAALPPKTPCPGDHQGFYVCMSQDSSFNDKSLEQVVSQGLEKLATLVNSSSFQGQVTSAFSTDGSSIDTNLTAANYIVTISGFCDASSDVLANAVVGGNSINYNECRVQRDANGNPDLAFVSGVLLHEISHNLGYTHPAVDPSRMTVPYYLGDLAEEDLTNGGTPTQQPTRRHHHTFGD